MKFSLFKTNTDDPKIYSPKFSELRKTEYFRLDNLDRTYLDFTGSGLYPQTLVDLSYTMLSEGVFGNPHASNEAALNSRKAVEQTRAAVLDYFDAEDYECVFTESATAGLRIIGDYYPFEDDSIFLLTVDNHNSVNSLRESALLGGGQYEYVKLNSRDFTIDNNDLTEKLHSFKDKKHKLFAYPAQSNVTGIKHAMNKINIAQKNGWDVLLDAAAFAPTNPFSLKRIKPDFVCISFYKMFGYPTGIGCLLIKKDKMSILNKYWTKDKIQRLDSKPEDDIEIYRNTQRLEDGTANFLGIPLVGQGLEYLHKIGMDRIQIRMENLTNWTIDKLLSLTHSNGSHLIKIFGPISSQKRGNAILMNIYDKTGKKFPVNFVEAKAQKNNLDIRTGCFWNPGIDRMSGNSLEEYLRYYSHDETMTDEEMIQHLEQLQGATRISFGIPTIQKDIDRFLTVLEKLVDYDMEANPKLVSDTFDFL